MRWFPALSEFPGLPRLPLLRVSHVSHLWEANSLFHRLMPGFRTLVPQQHSRTSRSHFPLVHSMNTYGDTPTALVLTPATGERNLVRRSGSSHTCLGKCHHTRTHRHTQAHTYKGHCRRRERTQRPAFQEGCVARSFLGQSVPNRLGSFLKIDFSEPSH